MSDATEVYERVTSDWGEWQKSALPVESFEFHSSTGSTNDLLLAKIRGGKSQSIAVIAADHQTAGRGRRGDRWHAPSGKNLLFSLSLPLPENREVWSRLPVFVGRHLSGAIQSVIGRSSDVQVKWPNDVYLDGKKLAGILVETVLTPRPLAIVGVGVNVNVRREEFPPDILDTATSLYDSLGCESDRWYLFGQILEGILSRYPEELSNYDSTHRWLTEHNFLEGRRVEVAVGDTRVAGEVVGVGMSGSLLVRTADGVEHELVSCEELVFC